MADTVISLGNAASLSDGGEMGALVRAHDWAGSPIGPPEDWPQPLRTLIGVMLAANQPMFLAWGPERTLLYNDAYAEILASKHPAALGRDVLEVWHEIRADLVPIVEDAYAGRPVRMDDIELRVERRGYPEETHFSFSYTPVRDDAGNVQGFLCACAETTRQVLSERRMAFRLALEERLRKLDDPDEIMTAALALVGEHLGLDRVGYAEIVDSTTVRLTGCHMANGIAPLTGQFSLKSFGEARIARQMQGITEVCDDVQADPEQDDEVWAAIDTRAFISVPLVREGTFRASLYVSHRTPRQWTPEEVALVEQVAARTWDAVERTRSEAALRASEARLSFLDQLGAETAALSRADDVLRTTTRLLGEHLGVSVCAYADMDEDEDGFTIRGDWAAPGATSIVGHYRLADFGRLAVANLSAGQPLVVNDNLRELAPEEAATFQSIGIAATICMPLVKEGRLTALMAIHDRVPRAWTEEELALLREVTERSWAYIERVGAAAELRQSEARLAEERRALATLVEHLPVGVVMVDRDGTTLLHNAAYVRIVPEAVIPSRLTDAQERWVGFDADGQRIGRSRFPGVRALRGELVRNAEFLHRAPDGQETWTHVSGVPLRDTAGDITGAICVVVDIDAQKRAEERLQLATEAAELGIFDVDFTTGAMAWDARQRELWGIGPDQVITHEIFLAGIHAEDRERVQAILSQAYDPDGGGLYAAEFRLRSCEDGRERWIAATGRVHFDGDKPVRLIGTVQDVTTRRHTEAALRQSEAQFRAFAQAVPNHVWAARPDGALYWFNDQIYAYSGAQVGTLDGSAWARIVHPDDLPAASASWAHVLASGEVYETEFRIRRHDGSYRWFLVRAEPVRGSGGQIVNWVGTNTDIEGRRRAEAKLRELNETLEQRVVERTRELERIWQNSQDLQVVVDGDGVFTAVSPAATRLLGWRPEEMIGRPLFEFTHPDGHIDRDEKLAGALAGPTETHLNRYRDKAGNYHWISWITTPADGLIYCSGRDVTAEVERKAELEAAQEQLRQSQKMEAMGQLTGGVAHDFNNLLTPIIASLDMLLRRGVGSERERRLMDGALQSAERAKVLVQRLLAFARRQPLQPRPVDVRELVAGMADLVASTSGPRIDMRVELPEDLPPALADANQLEMAVLNLAVNARDAMPDGGVLTISAARESVPGRHPANLRPGHYVRLSVTDTGTGMDEATLARAVEPFFSTKGIGKGTGLGLSMVHGLASQLGGGLTIASRLGQGTSVDLWLPISAVAAEEDGPSSSTAKAPRAQGTALLVDDEDLVRMSTADMLIDLGFEVTEATSAEEALRLIGDGLHPDLVVTDHLMPGMSGVDLARDLRSRRPDLPVLIVSGYAEMDGVAPGFPRLTKPFRSAELAASLTNLMQDTAG